MGGKKSIIIFLNDLEIRYCKIGNAILAFTLGYKFCKLLAYINFFLQYLYLYYITHNYGSPTVYIFYALYMNSVY